MPPPSFSQLRIIRRRRGRDDWDWGRSVLTAKSRIARCRSDLPQFRRLIRVHQLKVMDSTCPPVFFLTMAYSWAPSGQVASFRKMGSALDRRIRKRGWSKRNYGQHRDSWSGGKKRKKGPKMLPRATKILEREIELLGSWAAPPDGCSTPETIYFSIRLL
jgi:hypothetical protein